MNFRFFIFISAMFLSLPQWAKAACDQTLSPGINLASKISSASAGTTICLNSGSYGDLNLGTFTKDPAVLVQSIVPKGASMGLNAQNGANGVIFDGIKFTGGGVISGANTKNITIRNSDFGTSQLLILTAYFNSNNILIDRNTFGAFNADGGYEGRLQISWGGFPWAKPSDTLGVVISNNTFGPGGCSDGIQIGAHGVKVGPGNIFTGIRQGNCAAHVDAIQGYGQSSTVIDGNYFVGNTIHIGFYDGGSSETITNNVFGPPGDSAQNLQLGGIQGMKMAHNTFRNTVAAAGAKAANSPNSNWVVENNLFVNSHFTAGGDQPGCGNDCIMRYNLLDPQSSSNPSGTNKILGSPIFTGGASPTSLEGYQLAPNSIGKNAGNDGKDIGFNYFNLVITQKPAAPKNLNVR